MSDGIAGDGEEESIKDDGSKSAVECGVINDTKLMKWCEDMSAGLIKLSSIAARGREFDLAAKFDRLGNAFKAAADITEKNVAVARTMNNLSHL